MTSNLWSSFLNLLSACTLCVSTIPYHMNIYFTPFSWLWMAEMLILSHSSSQSFFNFSHEIESRKLIYWFQMCATIDRPGSAHPNPRIWEVEGRGYIEVSKPAWTPRDSVSNKQTPWKQTCALCVLLLMHLSTAWHFKSKMLPQLILNLTLSYTSVLLSMTVSEVAEVKNDLHMQCCLALNRTRSFLLSNMYLMVSDISLEYTDSFQNCQTTG